MDGRTDLGEYFGTEVEVINHSRQGEIGLFKGPFVASTSVHLSWAGEGRRVWSLRDKAERNAHHTPWPSLHIVSTKIGSL